MAIQILYYVGSWMMSVFQYFAKRNFELLSFSFFQDPSTSTYWMIYDNKTGKLTPLGVDSYQPKDGSVTVFRLEKVASHTPSTERPTETKSSGHTTRPSTERPTKTLTKSSGHKFVGLGLVVLCLLSAIESLLSL